MNKKTLITVAVASFVALAAISAIVISILVSSFSVNELEKEETSAETDSSIVTSANKNDTTSDENENSVTVSGNNSSESETTTTSNATSSNKSESDKNVSEDKNSSTGTSQGNSSNIENDNTASTLEDEKELNVELNDNPPKTAAFYIPDATVSKGAKFKLPVKVVNNPGFMGLQMSFDYDTSVLKYTGYKKGELLSPAEIDENNGTIKILAIENGDVKKDGSILYLEFEVISDTTKQTELKVNIAENGAANQSEEYVKYSSQNGKITIK